MIAYEQPFGRPYIHNRCERVATRMTECNIVDTMTQVRLNRVSFFHSLALRVCDQLQRSQKRHVYNLFSEK